MTEVIRKKNQHNKDIEDQMKLREALKKENDFIEKIKSHKCDTYGDDSVKTAPSKAVQLGASMFMKKLTISKVK